MRSIKVEELSVEKFLPFGYYANLINPEAGTEKIGAPPVEFFRDMVPLQLGPSTPMFSTCRVEPRPFVLDWLEYHTYTGEGTLPLDNDIIVYVGPATAGDAPLDRVRAFKVPKGTMIALRPGVWHAAPYSIDDKAANVLIVLPERTYMNDCIKIELAGDDRIEIR